MKIAKELARLRGMGLAELREKYAEVFGEETRSTNKSHLFRRIAWRLQANEMGGLSERAKRRAAELAKTSDLRLTAPRGRGGPVRKRRDPRLPMVGTVLTRQYRGQEIRVEVLQDCFLFEGKSFKTLSAVARHITGSHLSGPAFFGLNKRRRHGKKA